MPFAADADYRRNGWALQPGVFTTDELALVIAELDRTFPTGEAFAADPGRYPGVAGDPFAGLRMWPTGIPILDDLVTDPRLVCVAQELVGEGDVRLLRAGYQAKYTGAADYEQVLHYDYPNHSLVVPGPDDIVGFFLYLSDIGEADGATRLVSEDVTRDLAPDLTHLPVGHVLYDAERPACGGVGSLLAYRSTTYHRGAPMTASGSRRLTLSFSYARPLWQNGYTSWPRRGEEPELVEFLRRASPEARRALGFPPPGADYWTDTTIRLVERRYGIHLDGYR